MLKRENPLLVGPPLSPWIKSRLSPICSSCSSISSPKPNNAYAEDLSIPTIMGASFLLLGHITKLFPTLVLSSMNTIYFMRPNTFEYAIFKCLFARLALQGGSTEQRLLLINQGFMTLGFICSQC